MKKVGKTDVKIERVAGEGASVTSFRSSVLTGSSFSRSLARRSFDSRTCAALN